MAERTRPGRRQQVLHPARQPVADHRLGGAVHDDARRGLVPQRLVRPAGLFLPGAGAAGRTCSSAGSAPSSARTRHGIYNLHVDRSFRMGMMWFIFSEVMFFARLLRRAVLRAHALGAVARRRGREVLHQLHPVAALRGRAGRPTARRTSAAAPTAPSRSFRRSACRRSTPRSCSPAASRSPSRITRCAPAIAACSRSSSR